DSITDSMKAAIDETDRRRAVQEEYNKKHGITPKSVAKSTHEILRQTKVADSKKAPAKYYVEDEEKSLVADPVTAYMSKDDLTKLSDRTRKAMEQAARDLDFMEAARLRDEYLAITKLIEEKK
ncbi:MAG: UvrB/UvrC motif-containing protein, partial [Bacteroidota bacterium]